MAAKPHKPAPGAKKPTPDQHRARTEIAILSAAWNNLTDEQREGWARFAQSDRRGGLAARRRRRTGRTAFFRVNSRRFAAWQDLLDFPPWAAGCCTTPLVRLIITHRAGLLSLKVRLSGGPAEGLMISSCRPCNPGVMVCPKFTRIGLLRGSKARLIDITKLYVDKFGWPPIGKKIFIQVQQMQDYSGKVLHTASAIVRAEGSSEDVQKTL
jgi:hypothetical protein